MFPKNRRSFRPNNPLLILPIHTKFLELRPPRMLILPGPNFFSIIDHFLSEIVNPYETKRNQVSKVRLI